MAHPQRTKVWHLLSDGGGQRPSHELGLEGKPAALRQRRVSAAVEHLTSHLKPSPQVVQTLNFQGTKTISDFVREGGPDYSLIFDNCHLGSGRMMKP